MRRGSVVAPLLLIAIGALFLARNLYPEIPLLDYFSRYWPFLLIAWGILRLAEVLFWASTGRSLPRAGISGGEWVLVIFLCIFGSGLHTARNISTWWPRRGIVLGGLDMFGQSYDYPISGQIASSAAPKIVIESFRGAAHITGADTDSVKVTGHRSIRSFEQRGADRANAEAPFVVSGGGNQITIRSNQDRIGGDLRVSSDMEITVPRGATIEAHGRNGDFDVNGIAGIDIVSENAGVRLQNITGDARIVLQRADVVRAINVQGAVDLKGRGADVDLQNIGGPVTVAGTYSGVIQFRNLSKPLRFNGQVTELSVEKLPGQVRMALGDFNASNLVGPVHLSTRSRDVQVADFTNALEVSVERGDIRLRPGELPLARIDAQTRAGDVTLSIPAGAKFDLTATVERGDVTNDFGPPLNLESEGHGATLRGSTGGGAAVKLHAERGSVTVRKASPGDKSLQIPLPSGPLKTIEQ